jgi:hypothetical protein
MPGIEMNVDRAAVALLAGPAEDIILVALVADSVDNAGDRAGRGVVAATLTDIDSSRLTTTLARRLEKFELGTKRPIPAVLAHTKQTQSVWSLGDRIFTERTNLREIVNIGKDNCFPGYRHGVGRRPNAEAKKFFADRALRLITLPTAR